MGVDLRARRGGGCAHAAAGGADENPIGDQAERHHGGVWGAAVDVVVPGGTEVGRGEVERGRHVQGRAAAGEQAQQEREKKSLHGGAQRRAHGCAVGPKGAVRMTRPEGGGGC